MKYKFLAFVFTIIGFSIELTWSSLPIYKISAGHKTIVFEENNFEWSNFCFDQKMGCARFKVKKSDKIKFGMIKIISDQISLRNFDQYCQDVFNESKKIDKSLVNYSIKNEKGIINCSWEGQFDKTYLFWKGDITIMVTTSDKNENSTVISLINKAKLYEIP